MIRLTLQLAALAASLLVPGLLVGFATVASRAGTPEWVAFTNRALILVIVACFASLPLQLSLRWIARHMKS